jgi:hypothetical protein
MIEILLANQIGFIKQNIIEVFGKAEALCYEKF